MKRAFLTDVPAGKTYDLVSLLKEHDKITIGRLGCGDLIQPGNGLSDKLTKKTETITVEDLAASQAIGWVSAKHAVIEHRKEDGYKAEGFYLTDVGSRHGTKIKWIKNSWRYNVCPKWRRSRIWLLQALYIQC